jgi:hypothetical protein
MQEPDLFLIFIKPLNNLKLQYMVTGAAAAIVYGEPRFTHDLDVVLELCLKDLESFIKMFPLESFYCPPDEILRQEVALPQKGHFNLIHHETGFKADIYLYGKDPLHHWAMALRRSIDFKGEKLWVAPPEYVIVRKLQYYQEGGSEKHLTDIIAMLEISKESIDMTLLEKKISENKLNEVWKNLKV